MADKMLKEIDAMNAEEKELPNGKRTTLCHCPKCGAEHKMRMNWIGRGRPRKYCPICRNAIKSVSGNVYWLHPEI